MMSRGRAIASVSAESAWYQPKGIVQKKTPAMARTLPSAPFDV
jgi:hypothetical protein